MATTHFRLYLFDRENQPLHCFDVIAGERQIAKRRARELSVKLHALSYELWQVGGHLEQQMNRQWQLAAKEERNDKRRSQ
ncbi:MAG TPA: hypothetical protein VGL83_12690 [Stellaceae bacterium]|jgi:hypothetical protein